jgi:hypothetical protein
MGLLQSCKRTITAVVGPAKLAASCRGALSHGSPQPQPRRTMQIALPGSLHRVIMWLCSSVHSVTIPQPRHTMQIALPGSLHRVIVSLCSSVHSVTTIHHSRGTRCRSPCRARCIVSSCRCALTHSFPPQSRHTMQISLPGSLHRVIVWLCTHSQLSKLKLQSNTAEAHDADRPAGLAASCRCGLCSSFQPRACNLHVCASPQPLVQ